MKTIQTAKVNGLSEQRAFLRHSNLFLCIAADGTTCIIQWLHFAAADNIVELAFLATSAKTTGIALNALHLGVTLAVVEHRKSCSQDDV